MGGQRTVAAQSARIWPGPLQRGIQRPIRPALEQDIRRFQAALEARFGVDLITLAVFGSQVGSQTRLRAGRRRDPVTSWKISRDYLAKEDDLLPPSALFEQGEAEDVIAAVERLVALYRDLLATAPD